MKKELLICTLSLGWIGVAGAEPTADPAIDQAEPAADVVVDAADPAADPAAEPAEPAADHAAALKSAAEKLAAAANYSWSTSTAFGDREARATTGKKGGGGFVHLMVPRRDDSTEVLLRNGKVAVNGEDGWELVSGEGEGDGNRRMRFLARMAENFADPTTQATELVGKVADVKQEEGTYRATLSEEAAQELLSFRRWGRGRGRGGDAGGDFQPPPITGAAGTVQFTVTDGVLTKYEVDLSGTMNFNGEDRNIGRKTVVEFSNVGSTSFEIPEVAAGLLAGS